MTVHDPAEAERWFVPVDSNPDAEARLFLFPYAGGNAGMYREWMDLFPASISVQGVQLPGRLNRREEGRFTEMEPLMEVMVEAFVAELDDRPYAFFGHSMGGLVAYRLAVALERELGTPPALIGAAGWSPEGFYMPTEEQIALPQDELVSWIVSLGSLPPAIYEDPEMLRITIPPTRDDLLICARYVEDGAKVDTAVVTYTGKDDPLMTRESAATWADHCTTYLGNCEFPGGHFFIYDATLAIATDFTRHLLRCLEPDESRLA
ncbi:MAG: thioesterase II family protein [Frankiaceae bacterium]